MRRLAIIDACNVLHCSAGLALNCDQSLKSCNKVPDAIGLLIVVHELLLNEFDVQIIIQESYMNQNRVKNYFILEVSFCF